MLLCGDFNAHISNQPDIITEVDTEVAPRVSIDNVQNSHGRSLLEFLKDNKCCIINGRVSPENDNYTFISQRGKSVVAYFITFHNGLKFCESFKVVPSNELVESFNLERAIGVNCKSPDHSMLILTCRFSYVGQYTNCKTNLHSNQNYAPCSSQSKIYNFGSVTNDFLNNETWKRYLSDTIDKLDKLANNQVEVDEVYSELCKVLFSEMDCHLEVKTVFNKRVRKRLKVNKPFWDEELTTLWKKMRGSEKNFISCKSFSGNLRKNLRGNFKHAMNKFDKMLRNKERKYNREQILQIDQVCDKNPEVF